MKILRTARLGSNFTDSYKTGRQKDTKEVLWRQIDCLAVFEQMFPDKESTFWIAH